MVLITPPFSVLRQELLKQSLLPKLGHETKACLRAISDFRVPPSHRLRAVLRPLPARR